MDRPDFTEYLENVLPALLGGEIAKRVALVEGTLQAVSYISRTARKEHWNAQQILWALDFLIERYDLG
jgi:hypothetical protein